MDRFSFLRIPVQWLEDRLGIPTGTPKFLSEPLPEKVGWPHVLGSMLLALFALELLTGILLSFVYSPSPDSAHASVRYLNEEMKGGAWLRGIHHWGAYLMVAILGLHLLRTFLYAAYRKPREITWIVGVLLLLCVLAFAQTGFLLPWDQMAYWGTEVTIQIISTAPLVGSQVGQLLRGGTNIGGFALSRFYSLHTAILPLVTVLLILGHLFLIRRYGITAPWTNTDDSAPRKTPFYPYQTVRDSAAMLMIVTIVFLLAAVLPPELGNPADPSDNSVVPRPDWYFLFLFQLLHHFQGKWEVIGTFVLPNLGILLLLSLPFLDRNPSRKLSQRPVAIALAIVSICSWAYLTYAASAQKPETRGMISPRGLVASRTERVKRPSEVGGVYVLGKRCLQCHAMTAAGNRPLETLAQTQFPAGKPWLQSHLREFGKDTDLSEQEVNEILSVLRLVTNEQSHLLYTIPWPVRFGAHTFHVNDCINCHTVDGQGGKKGPDLTIRPLHSKEWHIQHIRDPQSVVSDSKMMEFPDFSDAEYSALADYILYLHSP